MVVLGYRVFPHDREHDFRRALGEDIQISVADSGNYAHSLQAGLEVVSLKYISLCDSSFEGEQDGAVFGVIAESAATELQQFYLHWVAD